MATISPLPPIDVSRIGTTWADDLVDLTDRRRLLVRAVFGVDLAPPVVDRVFEVDRDQPSSSTTRRSAGRAPSTEET